MQATTPKYTDYKVTGGTVRVPSGESHSAAWAALVGPLGQKS